MVAFPFIFLLLGFGAVMIKAGRWPQRAGDALHCAKCEYILVGEVRTCPECGNDVSRGNVVRGKRKRRPGLTWMGVGVVFLGLAVLGENLRSDVDWKHYQPFGWLMRDFQSSNSSTAAAAWTEISRRIAEKRLSEENMNALVEEGLQLQASGKASPAGNDIFDIIGSRYLDQTLSPAQADRFFAGMLNETLQIRPIVGTESRVPYGISGAGIGPTHWRQNCRIVEFGIDDGPAQALGINTVTELTGSTCWTTAPPVAAPGLHHLRLRLEIAADARGPSIGPPWYDSTPVVARRTADLSAAFQVVQGQTPITTVTSPPASALAPLLKTTIFMTPKSIQFEPQLSLQTYARSLPIDVAFDVFIRFGGKEYAVGSVGFKKGTPSGWGAAVTKIPENVPPNVDVIFRSSPDAARTTTNITQIWKGEIVLSNVVVSRP